MDLLLAKVLACMGCSVISRCPSFLCRYRSTHLTPCHSCIIRAICLKAGGTSRSWNNIWLFGVRTQSCSRHREVGREPVLGKAWNSIGEAWRVHLLGHSPTSFFDPTPSLISTDTLSCLSCPPGGKYPNQSSRLQGSCCCLIWNITDVFQLQIGLAPLVSTVRRWPHPLGICINLDFEVPPLGKEDS